MLCHTLSNFFSLITQRVSDDIRQQSAKLDMILAGSRALEARLEREHTSAVVSTVIRQNQRDLGEHVSDRLRSIDVSECDPEERQMISFVQNLSSEPRTLGLHDESLLPTISVNAIDAPKRRQHGPDVDIASIGRSSGSVIHSLPNYKATAAWQLMLHKFPVGVLTVASYQKETYDQQSGRTGQPASTHWSITFNLFPAKWIASQAVKLTFATNPSRFTAPNSGWDVALPSYNDDAAVLACVRKCDTDRFAALLSEGRARCTDLVGSWANSLLHVSDPMLPSSRFSKD